MDLPGGKGAGEGLVCLGDVTVHRVSLGQRLGRATVALGLIFLVGNSYWEHATQAVSKWLTLLL